MEVVPNRDDTETTLVVGGNDERAQPTVSVFSRNKKKVALVGFVTAAVVVAVVLVLVLGSSDKSQVGQDNAQTTALYQKLQKDAATDSTVTITSHVLDDNDEQFANVSKWISGATRSGALDINAVKISLQTETHAPTVEAASTAEESESRMFVHISGSTTFLGQRMNVVAHIRYVNNKLQFFMRTVDPVLTPNSLAMNPIPAEYSNLHMRNMHLFVASEPYDDPTSAAPQTCIPQGLSFTALADPYNSEAPVMRVLSKFLSSSSSSVSKRSLRVSGVTQLAPVKMQVATLSIQTIDVGSDVHLENVTVQFKPLSEILNVSAVLVISPSGIQPLYIGLSGVLFIKNSTFRLSGDQIGSWEIPGQVDGLVLSRASAAIQIAISSSPLDNAIENSQSEAMTESEASGGSSGIQEDSSQVQKQAERANRRRHFRSVASSPAAPASSVSVQGLVSIEITYGTLGGFLKLDLPPTNSLDGDKVALEVLFADQFSLTDLPAVSSVDDYPNLGILKSALVFSAFDGVFTFSDPKLAPVPSAKVVSGMNLFLTLDLQQSPSLRSLYSPDSSSADALITLHSTINQTGAFQLQGDLTNLLFDDNNFTIQHINISINSFSPYVQLGALITGVAGVIGSDQPVSFDTLGTAFSTGFALTGNVTGDWEVNVGGSPLGLQNAFIQFSYDSSSDPTVHVLVLASVTIFGVNVNLKYQYPPSISSMDGCMCPVYEIDNLNGLSLSTIVSGLLPPNSAQLNQLGDSIPDQVFQQLLDNPISDVNFLFSPTCKNVTLSANINTEVFGAAQVGLLLHRDCQDADADSDGWRYHIYVIPAPDWSLSTSVLAGGHFPNLNIQMPVFLLSSEPEQVTIDAVLGADQSDTTIVFIAKQGLNMVAKLVLDNSPDVQLIKQLVPGAVALELDGQFGKTSWSIDMQLDQGASDPIPLGLDNMELTNLFARIRSLPSSEAAFSLGGELHMPDPSNPQSDTLVFDVEGDYDSSGVVKFVGSIRDTNASVPINIGAGLQLVSLKVGIDVQWSQASGAAQGTVVGGTLGGDISLHPNN